MKPSRSLRHVTICLITGFVLSLPPLVATDIDLEAPLELLESFHEHYGSAMYAYPRHSASPLGITGWEISGSVGYIGDFDENEFAEAVLGDDLALDGLAPIAVQARKGLPWNVDIGLSWARDLDLDLDRWAAEAQWAFLEGSTVAPAMALRVTAGQGEGDVYRLRQTGVEVLISKGFTILTPFAGAGVVYSEGRFDFGDSLQTTFDTTQTIYYVGATLNLLLPKITATMEKGEDLMWVIQIGFGF